jgi:hypothetical protein
VQLTATAGASWRAMSSVHIEGMGIIGSLLARLLDERGVEFTWHDTEERINAWRASTGCVYPGADVHDEACHANWLRWADGPFAAWTERALYWFNHKHPPHGGRYEITLDRGWLRRGDPVSVHLNAQTLVRDTRAWFADRRTPRAPRVVRGRYVVAHGFSEERLEECVWGWTVPVQLSCTDVALTGLASGMRSALYLRKGRFVMVYAYPRPDTAEWYAGSSLIVQQKPKELDAEKHYARWLRQLDELTGGRVQVTCRGEALQGWRPRGELLDEQQLAVWAEPDGKLYVPPMWHNGIRHFPVVAAQVLQKLGAL